MTTIPLFDLEPTDARAGDDVTHVLMPAMSYACGGSILTKRGHFQVGIRDWSAIDCAGCRSIGEDVLRTEMRRQQGGQAGAA